MCEIDKQCKHSKEKSISLYQTTYNTSFGKRYISIININFICRHLPLSLINFIAKIYGSLFSFHVLIREFERRYMLAQAYTPSFKFLSLRIWAFCQRLSFSFVTATTSSYYSSSSSRFFCASRASLSQQHRRQSTLFYSIIYTRANQPNNQAALQSSMCVCECMRVRDVN